MIRPLRIGLMDSGIGGLSILRTFIDEKINAEFFYVADSYHLPYGTKTDRFIIERTERIAHFLFSHHQIDAFIIACNTATAAAADNLRAHRKEAIIIGIEPAVKPAALKTKSGHIAVCATESTIQSERLNRLIATYSKAVEVHKIAAPKWVSLVERGEVTGEQVRSVLKETLAPFANYPIDQITLGCTHFPFLAEELSALLPSFFANRVQLINPARPLIRHTLARLSARKLHPNPTLSPHFHYFTSGEVERFEEQLKKLHFPIHQITPFQR